MYLPITNLSSWNYLILSIVLEVLGTTFMKMAAVSSKRFSFVLMLFFYSVSIHLLLMAVKKLDVGVAYAVWSGVATALIAAVGIYVFKESANTFKFMSVGLIILGVIGLQLTGGEH